MKPSESDRRRLSWMLVALTLVPASFYLLDPLRYVLVQLAHLVLGIQPPEREVLSRPSLDFYVLRVITLGFPMIAGGAVWFGIGIARNKVERKQEVKNPRFLWILAVVSAVLYFVWVPVTEDSTALMILLFLMGAAVLAALGRFADL